MILRFYESNEREPGAERFMLWERFLSDGPASSTLFLMTGTQCASNCKRNGVQICYITSWFARHLKGRLFYSLIQAEELPAIFDGCVLQAQLQQSTTRRQGYMRAVVRPSSPEESPTVKLLIPMAQDTLKAISQVGLMIGLSAATVRNLRSAV